MKRVVFSKAEDELMLFLWESAKPSRMADILLWAGKKRWSNSRLCRTLTQLKKKKAISFSGNGSYVLVFTDISKAEYYLQLAEDGKKPKPSFLGESSFQRWKLRRREKREKEIFQKLEEILAEYALDSETQLWEVGNSNKKKK